ncbi:MAG: NifB/NifX family molybdenum-iron cluster-binding protein [Elusimicrobiota bacterium]|nr:NifB/NifX family molybdenum-iron cluster-binding protein [Elusimicrobiota bacterium]
MKVCVTSLGQNLSDNVDPKFGRCAYFIIVDTDSMEFKAEENSAVTFSGGAGPAAVSQIAGFGAEVLLTGAVGPNAFRALSAAGIKVVTGAKGSVREAIEDFKKGNASFTDSATAESHSGM